MTDKVQKLHVIKPPTAAEEIRVGLITMLEDTIAEVKSGDITEVLMLIQHADPAEWTDRSSMSTNIMAWVGRLETTKLDWIDKYKSMNEYRNQEHE